MLSIQLFSLSRLCYEHKSFLKLPLLALSGNKIQELPNILYNLVEFFTVAGYRLTPSNGDNRVDYVMKLKVEIKIYYI
jgi:Leucine-rich repeat (LRR) protein